VHYGLNGPGRNAVDPGVGLAARIVNILAMIIGIIALMACVHYACSCIKYASIDGLITKGYVWMPPDLAGLNNDLKALYDEDIPPPPITSGTTAVNFLQELA